MTQGSCTIAARRWATVREAAEYLRVSRSFIYRLVETGAIPVLRLGRRVLLDLDDVEATLQRRCAS